METTAIEDDDADADPSAAVFEFDGITSAVVDLGVIDEVSTSTASVEVKVVYYTLHRYIQSSDKTQFKKLINCTIVSLLT